MLTEAIGAFVIVWTLFTYLLYTLWALAAIFVAVVCIRAYMSIMKEYSSKDGNE
jgi:hypothetical protein